jgi:long-chain fatty acid transport protein
MNFWKTNSHFTAHTLSVVAVMFILAGSNALATNGYFQHGYGAKSTAMAGVATALPEDAFAAAINPAEIAFLPHQYNIVFSLFNPNRHFTVTGQPSGQEGTFPLTPGSVTSNSKWFIVPGLAANWILDPKNALAITAVGNGGMNTNYPAKVFDNPMAPVTSPTGVDLSQLFVSASFAHKLAANHSLGLSAILAYQMFEAKGLQAFAGFSTAATTLTDNKHATSSGFGARFGYFGKPVKGLNIGASYQTKINTSKFKDYAGLFAEQGGFDVPANWTVGAAVDLNRTLTLASDFQQILYSGVKSIANPMNPQNFQQGVLLGADNAAGFGWRDMSIIKVGMEWRGIVDLPLRAGYSYGRQPIPSSEMMFNILAPGVIEQHITFGLSHKFCKQRELSLSVMKALNKEISGPNPMEIPGQQTIGLAMNQWEFSLGMSF